MGRISPDQRGRGRVGGSSGGRSVGGVERSGGLGAEGDNKAAGSRNTCMCPVLLSFPVFFFFFFCLDQGERGFPN